MKQKHYVLFMRGQLINNITKNAQDSFESEYRITATLTFNNKINKE